MKWYLYYASVALLGLLTNDGWSRAERIAMSFAVVVMISVPPSGKEKKT